MTIMKIGIRLRRLKYFVVTLKEKPQSKPFLIFFPLKWLNILADLSDVNMYQNENIVMNEENLKIEIMKSIISSE